MWCSWMYSLCDRDVFKCRSYTYFWILYQLYCWDIPIIHRSICLYVMSRRSNVASQIHEFISLLSAIRETVNCTHKSTFLHTNQLTIISTIKKPNISSFHTTNTPYYRSFSESYILYFCSTFYDSFRISDRDTYIIITNYYSIYITIQYSI